MESIRFIEPKDNVALAAVIRAALTEFGANKPGTVYFDPTTDNLSALFETPGSVYYVAEKDNEILGGCGIFHTVGLPDKTCELVKLYLAPGSRGTGLGKALMLKAMAWAKEAGYEQVYLETMPELSNAVTMYEKLGYNRLPKSLGNSGHDGCSIWMLKAL
ncbi:MAG: GNAT family N-acetyltransferase [Sediminibacterium sp.]|nr:GNAT family N-acetyltransferase [Sediminibacterium sp.]MBP6144085.1 GNAT family N-acetyltransferase [Sediminibacterium sp.]